MTTTETKPATATHTVCHVEIPAKDQAKLIAFYSGLFGWQFQRLPGMEDYPMAQASGGEMPCGVAIYTPDAEDANVGIRNAISVESVDAYASKLEELGGTVTSRFTVNGMGYGAICTDPEGNPLALWHQDESAKE